MSDAEIVVEVFRLLNLNTSVSPAMVMKSTGCSETRAKTLLEQLTVFASIEESPVGFWRRK